MARKSHIAFLVTFLYAQATMAQVFHSANPKMTYYGFDTSGVFSAKAPVRLDTTNMHLWQIGRTQKPFFNISDSIAMMTDTVNVYPTNANDHFTIQFDQRNDRIFFFTHKYRTAAGHDGGVVEYSYDAGTTWNNIVSDCNQSTLLGDIPIEGFYTANDTLSDGLPAFSGTSNAWITSEIQFLNIVPIRTTGGTGNCPPPPVTVYLRFRFISDSTADSLDGWIIRDIGIEKSDYGAAVTEVTSYNILKVYPNPSYDGIYRFPAIQDMPAFQLTITNATGNIVLQKPYAQRVDLSALPQGIYFYRAGNGSANYYGSLLKD